MGHLSPSHQWDTHRHNMFLLTLVRARGIGISPRVRHRHRVFRRQAKGVKAWVEVEGRTYRLGLRGPRGESTPLHHKLRWKISRSYKVLSCYFIYGQGFCLTRVHCIHALRGLGLEVETSGKANTCKFSPKS